MVNQYINIILGSGEWSLYHRKEFTKELVNNKEEITFVNLPVSLLVNIFVKLRTRYIPYFLGKNKLNKDNGFFIYTPLMLSHYLFWRKSSLIANIDSFFLSFQINRFIKKYYPNKKVRLWVYMPEQKYFIGKVNYDLLIYDSYDDCDLNYDGTVNKKRAKLNETLIKDCDLVIVISKFTFDKYSKYTKNIIRSRGGFPLNLFGNSTQKINLTNSNKPILGYIGTFRSWIEYSLIDMLVESSKYTLVFVGHIDRGSRKYFAKILENENVVHINSVDAEKLPLYINNFSAGLIPFKINNFMKSVYPNKFFEYISSNIPVITTALPELEIFKEYLGFSENNKEFLENCQKAVDGEYISKISNYDEIKRNNDWDSIVKEIIKELRKLNREY